jgi:hypothetical protein
MSFAILTRSLPTFFFTLKHLHDIPLVAKMYDLTGPSDLHNPRLQPYPHISSHFLPRDTYFLGSVPLDKGLSWTARFFGIMPHVLYTCNERVGNERRPFALKIIDEYRMTPAF